MTAGELRTAYQALTAQMRGDRWPATGTEVGQRALGHDDEVFHLPTPPSPPDSPLYTLPNVVLTPHLAGAAGNELYRLRSWAVEELARWAAGEPFHSPVRLSDLAAMA